MAYAFDIKIDGESSGISLESGYVVIRENADFFVPSGSVVFRDRISNFVAFYPIMQDTQVEVSIDDGSSISRFDFYAFSSVKQESLKGIDSYETTIDLISKSVKPLLTDSEYHSKKCVASDYILYIADKCGLKSDVEPTKDVESWINPNWKFAQMVRYLAQRSVSATGSSGYLYFVNKEGVLVFKSVDKLFDEEAIDLTVGHYDIMDGDEEKSISNKSFVLKDNHFANVVLGANKLVLSHYDYKSGGLVSEEVNYEKYLKKRGPIKGVAAEFAEVGSKIYCGESYSGDAKLLDINKYIYNKVLRQLEATQVQIMIPWRNDIGVGRVVNLSVPANADLVTGGVNLNYSGRYLVKSVTGVGHGEFYQKLVLARPGISVTSNRKEKYL